jgi:hypothetical protein
MVSTCNEAEAKRFQSPFDAVEGGHGTLLAGKFSSGRSIRLIRRSPNRSMIPSVRIRPLRRGSTTMGCIMSNIIYPLEFLKRFEKRWTSQFGQVRESCSSNTIGTNVCDCGHSVIVPRQSTYSTVGAINQWHCSKCDRSWYTYADTLPQAERAPQGAR